MKENAMHFANLHFPHHVALVLFLVMLLALAAGCSRPPLPKTDASAGSSSSQTYKAAQPEKTPGQRLDQASADAKRTAGDATLTVKVKAALANDAGLKTLKLDVDSNSGVVTLKGQVDTDDAKKRIQEIAQAVPGVTWVQNQISVAPKPS
jgi:hyperosmotically inducible periplasmic protein